MLINAYTYDPELAKEFLAKSSYDGSYIEIVTNNGFNKSEDIAIYVSDCLNKIGMNTGVKIVEVAELMSMDMQKKMNLSYLFISHDLSVVRHISNRIAVMYLGQIVETADADEMFLNTMHPYSIALLSAVPVVQTNDTKRTKRIVLEGDVPSPMNPAPGCRFAPRCWMAHADCRDADPALEEVAPGHCVACFYAKEARERAEEIKNSLKR